MKKPFVYVIAGSILVLLLVSTVFVLTRKKGQIKEAPKLSFLKEADKALLGGDLVKAKKLYEKAKEQTDNVSKLKAIQEKIEYINTKLLFSTALDECSTIYVVKPNDALAKIARAFNTTVNFIKRANGLESNTIWPGQQLKINTCKFSIVIDKSQNILFLKRAGEVIKTYTVATGKDKSTPIGNFKIVNKLINPTWFRTGAVIPPDSPDNILGSRWIGIDMKGYGIHGTNEPQNLGKHITMGCVRMKNEEVEELFDISPIGTEVVIVD
ncbi:MAG: L,D-transpeptidase family protein [Candidatus Omnitrophota bacterium]|nr:MAG: L,D-transpeptidase family protein [Candidatus Omnitrophota bacterium]